MGKKIGKVIKSNSSRLVLLVISVFLSVYLISFVSSAMCTEYGVSICPAQTKTIFQGNLTEFLNLTDTPSSYTGQGGNCVIVGAGETAIEFGSCTSGGNASWNQSFANTLYANIQWDYNQSLTTYELYSSEWNSTYNLTYADWNKTYADTLYADISSEGNASWNQSGANLLYSVIDWNYNQSLTTYYLYSNEWNSTYNATYNTYVIANYTNNSNYWDNIDVINTTQFYVESLILTLNETWFSDLFDVLFGAKSTDDLGEGSTNLYENVSWNESWADTLYADISSEGNASWNQSGANLIYLPFNIDSMYMNFYDDGSNLALNVSEIGGNNYFGIETSGGFFQLYANPNAGNDYLLATITETQGVITELNFYEGGSGHNRFWDSGSMRIGGGSSRLCSNITSDVDCVSGALGMGADLVVADDGWFGGKLFSSDWSNLTDLTDTLYATIGSGNDSWNQSGADLLYAGIEWDYNQSLTTYYLYSDEWNSTYNLTYSTYVTANYTNVSNYWDGLNTINTTQIEDNGGVFNILESWMTTFWSSMFNVISDELAYVNQSNQFTGIQNFTAEINMTNHDIVGVNCFNFTSGGAWCSA